MRSTLVRYGIFCVCLALLTALLAAYLVRIADKVDEGTLAFYEQPVWSEDESQVAYIRYESDRALSPQEARQRPHELWRVSRINGQPMRVALLGNEPYKLLGWINKDQALLLQPLASAEVPRILVAGIDGHQQEIRFEKEGLQLVSVQGGQVFFQKKASDSRWEAPGSHDNEPGSTELKAPALLRDEVALYTWAPGDSSVTKLVGIPTEGEEVSIEAAYPSPDGKLVAMVLKIRGELALWFYDKQQDRLQWSNIKIPATVMEMAWSPDGNGLVCAVDSPEGCDLYAFWNVRKLDYTRLRSRSAGKVFRPFWPRGEKHFLLLDDTGVFRFDPESRKAERVLGRYQQGQRADDMNVSPRGSWAVYHSREGESDNLYYLSLRSEQPRPLLPPPKRLVQHDETWYVVAQGLRTAWNYWNARN